MVIENKRCDDYLHTQRKAFHLKIRWKFTEKNEILNSNGTDQNKLFGSKTRNKAMNIRFKLLFTF